MGTEKRERQKQLRQQKIERLREEEKRSGRKTTALRIGAIVAVFVVFALVYSIVTSGGGDDEVASTDDTATDDTATDDAADAGDDGSDESTTTVADELPVPTAPVGDPVEPTCPPADGTAERTLDFTGPFEGCLTDGADYRARFTTSMGDVVVDLAEADMPVTVNNFVALARYRYYDDTLLFRTDPSIAIIQGGSPHTQNNTDPGPGYTIQDEGEFTTDESTGQVTGPYTYTEGELIMARSAGPDSTSAQFFFSTGPEVAALDSQGSYLPVGDVVEGLDVLQAIIATHEADPTSGLGGAPAEPVSLESVEIVEA